MTSHEMGRREFALLALGAAGAAAFATPRPRPPQAPQVGWTPLWNGKDLNGWTTWMQRPEPTSQVPGLARGADGSYTEAIGSNRDPLKVFTVVPDVDGKPAIRISGEVFGELRSTRVLEDYHLRFQFKWGEKKWPPRDGATRKRDSGLLYHVHAGPGEGGERRDNTQGSRSGQLRVARAELATGIRVAFSAVRVHCGRSPVGATPCRAHVGCLSVYSLVSLYQGAHTPRSPKAPNRCRPRRRRPRS
jgi:hypothetical protein